MGAGGSVDKKVAGEGKTFHVTLKDATHSRPQSGPSYCAEVHVRDDASQLIDILFICNEWGSSKGGLSTFNREFAVNLAQAASDLIKVHCYVCSSSEEDRQDANNQGVNLITARRPPGSNDPMEWLKIPPPELPAPDVVVGHGRKFGSAAYFIWERTKCKWIHFVHVFCEDLGKHKLEGSSTPDAIADNEEKNKRELELCEAADRVVAVGVSLQQKYIRRIPEIEVITPGLCEKFTIMNDPRQLTHGFRVFMIGRGSFEDFALKGYDIVGKAVALLGRKFELTFIGSPKDEQRRIEKWFLEETKIARNQLTIRGYRDATEMKKMFCEADVIVMPSRTEGFGLVALEAISAGVPVLVSSESGIAKALEKVEGGLTVVVNSDKPEDWAERIKRLSEQKPKDRHDSAVHLRDKYREIYTWKKECERFKQMINGLIQRPHKDIPLNYVLTDPTGNITIKVKTLASAKDKGLAQTNGEINPLAGANRVTSSLVNLKECTAAKSDRKGDSATGRTDATGATVLPSSSESTEASSNRKGGSATGPTGANGDPASVTSSESTASDSEGNSSTDNDETKGTSLHSAAVVSDVGKIESFLAPGFSIDREDDQGRTPLMLAAGNDKLQAVKCLLKQGADPSLQDNRGWNVLHHATQGGNPEVIELMLSHVPSIDSITNQGFTSLMIAADNGKLQAVKYLLEQGADPSLQDNSGWNALHYASVGGDVAIMEKILSYGIDIESRDKFGQTPLMIAQRKCKSEAVTYLLSKGAKS